LQPGRFQVLGDGKFVIYIEGLTRNRKLANNLFIAKEYPQGENNSRWDVVIASLAHQAKDRVSHEKLIVSNEGYRYEGTPGQNDYKIIQFESYAIKLPIDAINNTSLEQEARPTLTLWGKSHNRAAAAELQWRVSMPLAVIVLSFLAIPLCRVGPRKGRYANFIIAMLIYIVYINLLVVSRNWLEQKVITRAVGLWWVHAAFFMLGLLALKMQQFNFSWKWKSK
jgi:lipopolysaccharide export system permease protein